MLISLRLYVLSSQQQLPLELIVNIPRVNTVAAGLIWIREEVLNKGRPVAVEIPGTTTALATTVLLTPEVLNSCLLTGKIASTV